MVAHDPRRSCGLARLWSGGLRKTLEDSDADDDSSDGAIRSDVDPAWLKSVKWTRIINLPVPARNTTGVPDEHDEARGQGLKRELTHEVRRGTVIEFLDELEPVVTKYLVHRSTLARQKRSSLQFSRSHRRLYFVRGVVETERERERERE